MTLRRAGDDPLQWGHSPKAVENFVRQTRSLARLGTGFNGATARRPWRTTTGHGRTWQPTRSFNAATARRPWRTSARSSPVNRPSRRLQCGHSPKAVENPGVAVDRLIAVRRFNGATARRPWRTVSASDRRASTAWLQWGHSPKAVENNTSSRTLVLDDPRASMRPQPEGRGEHGTCLRSCPHRGASMRPQPEGRGERSTGSRFNSAA